MTVSRKQARHAFVAFGVFVSTSLLGFVAAGFGDTPDSSVSPVEGESAESRPNVVLILADDLGYRDLSIHGSTRVSTPHIDSIAARGVRFTDAYVTASTCSPTRAGLLTGRYQQRFGHELNPTVRRDDPNYNLLGLPPGEILLPQLMKNAGYMTGIVGKWHLGYAPHFMPTSRGFDEFFGFLGSRKTYSQNVYPDVGKLGGEVEPSPGTAYRDPIGQDRPNIVNRGAEQLVEEREYMTDAFGREAVDFIERHHRSPFFLYVAFNAVHEPLQVTQRYIDRVTNVRDPREITYVAMIIALDDAVGRILDALDRTGLADDTLVIFLGDNGGVFWPERRNFADNSPLRAGKMYVHEGGVRVPFMMRWPNHIEAGSVYGQLISSLDVLPTVVSAAHAELPSGRLIDGVDLMPYLSGDEEGVPHEFLAWRQGRNRALRQGDWKYLQYGVNAAQLFNLADDPGELRNLSKERPEKLQELLRTYSGWESQMIEPVFRANKPRPVEYDGELILFDM